LTRIFFDIRVNPRSSAALFPDLLAQNAPDFGGDAGPQPTITSGAAHTASIVNR